MHEPEMAAKVTILVTIILVPLCASSSKITQAEFLEEKMLEEKVCYPEDILFETIAPSLVSCGYQCGYSSQCHCASYIIKTRMCYGCKTTYNGNTELFQLAEGTTTILKELGDGIVYCHDIEDCLSIEKSVCVDGKCRCTKPMIYSSDTSACIYRFELKGEYSLIRGTLWMYHDNKWGVVSDSSWNWKATQSLCMDMPIASVHGGNFHKSHVYGPGPEDAHCFVLENLNCEGANSMADCEFKITEGCSPQDALGISCFVDGLTGSLQSNPLYLGNSTGHLQILKMTFLYETYVVCNKNWTQVETIVACRSFSSNYTTGEWCETNCPMTTIADAFIDEVSCRGDEPHLLYCMNGGIFWKMRLCFGGFIEIRCFKKE